jgi:hypothetical protein
MKIIQIIQVDGVNKPAEDFPDNAIRIISDGTNYTVYEMGDEIPPEPTPALNPNVEIIAKIIALEDQTGLTRKQREAIINGGVANVEAEIAELRARLLGTVS